MSRTRDELRRRYLSLGIGELAAAATFCAVGALAASGWPSDAVRALWCALVPLLVILLQGGAFWLLARRWVILEPMPRPIASAFRALRAVNPVILAVGLAGVVMWWPASTAHAVVVAFAWMFGVIEYINYFHVRLAYPPAKWFSRVTQWRTPQLVKDMRGVGWA